MNYMRSDDDEYYMDDDGPVEDLIISPEDDSDSTSDGEFDSDAKNVSDSGSVIGKTDESIYVDSNLTPYEVTLMTLYDNIRSLSSKQVDWEQSVYDVVAQVVAANPINTDKTEIQKQTAEILNKQGKNRFVSTAYDPVGLMSSEDVDENYTKVGSASTAAGLNEDARNQISRFIDYLAKRDLSRDNLSNKKRKRRHIPAFIIFLFSAGMYDLIIDCPTMPPLYQREIDNAFKTITKSKLNIVEALARKYEEKGRQAVADRVRDMGISWFEREPAEIRTLSAYRDLDLTSEDVMTYKEYKNKFTNISRNITQEVMSQLIAVYQEDGTFETLKDKTRQEAVDDVKKLFMEWSQNNPIDSETAQKIVWKKV